MSKVRFDLTEQFSDLRSNEIAYKFTIENQGTTPIELYKITPRIPDRVQLVEVNDPSLDAARSKYSALCRELTQLVNDYLITSSRELREKRAQEFGDLFQTLFERTKTNSSGRFSFSLLNPLSILSKSMTSMREKVMEQIRNSVEATSLQIDSAEHADLAFRTFLEKDDFDPILRGVFATKTAQLKELEGKIGKDIASSSIATIEPDSYFAATYVLRFPRSRLDPNKFNIDIEVNYAETGKPEKHTGGTSASIIISPQPIMLTLVAVAGSLLGVTLRIIADAPAAGTTNLAMDALHAITGGLALSAMILAVIIYNIYEHTDLGKRFNKVGIGWRGALFIGALCGLLSEQFVAAMKGFIGS